MLILTACSGLEVEGSAPTEESPQSDSPEDDLGVGGSGGSGAAGSHGTRPGSGASSAAGADGSNTNGSVGGATGSDDAGRDGTGGAGTGGIPTASGGNASGSSGGGGGAAGTPSDDTTSPEQVRADLQGLLITEYAEAGNDKALEISNRRGAPIDLRPCEVRLFTNGSSEPSRSIPLALSPDLEPGASWVLCHPQASESIRAACDQSTGNLNFNGDDAVGLWCHNVALDVIGQIGVDPGVAWTLEQLSTQDQTLLRECNVDEGRWEGAEPFSFAGWYQAAEMTGTLGNAGCD